MSARDDRRWKIGELARATGLTVRALHHYDEVGLLVPSERTSAGHRLYAEQDVRRLYRILALRGLGFRLDEIASVLDDGSVSLVETVRRHLEQVERELERQQRLRQRLRAMLEALEQAVEPSAQEFIDALQAMTVIEASVVDVLVWHGPAVEAAPPAEGAQRPPYPLREGQHAVVLREQPGKRVLPIWIGRSEGHALVLALSGQTAVRPLGPDLAVRLLDVGDARVERVTIESIRDTIFYATIVVARGGESHEVDARPSDALNLAVRVGAPVFVAAEVIEQSAVAETRLPLADAEHKPHVKNGDPEGKGAREDGKDRTQGEWRSALAEVRRSLEQPE